MECWSIGFLEFGVAGPNLTIGDLCIIPILSLRAKRSNLQLLVINGIASPACASADRSFMLLAMNMQAIVQRSR